MALARALLVDPVVLLLDEATAGLDRDTETTVVEATTRLRAGRTTVVVAHRLSTVVAANRIAVLDQGIIIEQGRHDELIAADGDYAAMWRRSVGVPVG